MSWWNRFFPRKQATDARDLLDRESDLPAIKLTIFQYVIVAVMAVLIFGLWRLQVVNAES